MGENSPHLVTLIQRGTCLCFFLMADKQKTKLISQEASRGRQKTIASKCQATDTYEISCVFYESVRDALPELA
jgi:hypothetical protein